MLSTKEREEEGFTVHAGADEQSEILFLRPEFVPQDYRGAESLTGRNFSDLVRIAKVNGWPGYFGAPRLASAAMGAQSILTFVAKAERSGTADSGRPQVQQDTPICRRDGSS